MNEIDYLVVSASIDYSTDLVCYQLDKRKKKYFRLNRDELAKHNIEIDYGKKVLQIEIDEKTYVARFNELKGVYFRAPVFLRTSSKKELTIQEQLERNQWNSFLRNLVVFENAEWINSPVSTYKAENKMLQLKIAEECGLKIPKTYVTNSNEMEIDANRNYIVKSLDTALFYDTANSKEMFTYSNVICGNEIKEYDLHLAPVFIQEFLEPKVDCRITFIKNKFFPIKIEKNHKGIYGDWRLHKDDLEYNPFVLPSKVENSLKELMARLNLNFGGIDLAYVKDEYFFIEVNPTGEWGWLEATVGINISSAIVDALEE